MADARKHVAHSGVDGWLARCTDRPKSVSSQVTEAAIPIRICRDRGSELRRAGVVLVDDRFVTLKAARAPADFYLTLRSRGRRLPSLAPRAGRSASRSTR